MTGVQDKLKKFTNPMAREKSLEIVRVLKK